MEIDKDKLRAKGWSEEEIKHAHKVISKAKRAKHPHRHALQETVFWALIIASSFAAAAIAYWFIPILTLFKDSVVYPFTIIIGLAFGLLFSHVMHELEHLERHHHLIIHTIIPLSAIVSFLLVIGRTNNFGAEVHNGILIGCTYALSFLSPYIYHTIKHKK